jgi:hypothetical protein
VEEGKKGYKEMSVQQSIERVREFYRPLNSGIHPGENL